MSGSSVFAIILASWALSLGAALLAEGDSRHQESSECSVATGTAASVLLLWRNPSHLRSAPVSFAALVVQLVLAIPALSLMGLVLLGFHSVFFA